MNAHDFHILTFRLLHADGLTKATSLGMLVFAVVFLAVGLWRSNEFKDYHFPLWKWRVLVGLHVIGCVVLFGCFVLFAIDLDRKYALLMSGFLASALVLLFPVQIYLGLLRRLRVGQR